MNNQQSIDAIQHQIDELSTLGSTLDTEKKQLTRLRAYNEQKMLDGEDCLLEDFLDLSTQIFSVIQCLARLDKQIDEHENMIADLERLT